MPFTWWTFHGSHIKNYLNFHMNVLLDRRNRPFHLIASWIHWTFTLMDVFRWKFHLPEMPASPGSVGLAWAQPLTKSQAMRPSLQTRSSYGPPYPLGRWLSKERSTSTGLNVSLDEISIGVSLESFAEHFTSTLYSNSMPERFSLEHSIWTFYLNASYLNVSSPRTDHDLDKSTVSYSPTAVRGSARSA